MLIIVLIILVLFIIYESLKGLSGTANQAPDNPTGIYQNDNSGNVNFVSVETDNGLSPIDIGGLSMGIPSGVLKWRALAEKYASINSNLDPEEILSIIWNESSGNPNAQNPGDPSWGLMGVTLLIGRAYAGVSQGTQLFDPETNIKAGSKYLSLLKDKYSENSDWADAYNVGETKYNEGIRSVNNGGYSIAFQNHLNTLKGLG